MGLDDRDKHIPQTVPKPLVLNPTAPNNIWTSIWVHFLLAFLMVMCIRYLMPCNNDNTSLMCNVTDVISAFVDCFTNPIVSGSH